jgi:diadenylate cyclase
LIVTFGQIRKKPMSQFIDSWLQTLIFRLSLVGWADIIDLLLVTIVLYVVFGLIRRSQAALLLRGVLLLLLVLFIVTIVVPLATFSLLMLVFAAAVVIAIPITLQPELRQWLENIGRTTFLSGTVRQDLVERVLPKLMRTVENLSVSKTGALIVLQGSKPLDDVAASGVAIDARLSAELIQTIFFNKTTLHDGAIILNDDELIAAGCILPLTNHQLSAPGRRFGTRHRAALGMSEASDALVIVVSEETGSISVAQNGRFRTDLDSGQLRKVLTEFYTDDHSAHQKWWQLRRPHFDPRSVLTQIAYLGVAFVLALALWLLVAERTNPSTREIVSGVTLSVVDIADGRTLAEPVPLTTDILIMTTADKLDLISAESFTSTISMAGVGTGKYRRTVKTVADDTLSGDVMILETLPGAIDIAITPVITVTYPVEVKVNDGTTLSAAYTIVGAPTVSPSAVFVSGPKTVVEQIVSVIASISVANASGSVARDVPAVAYDVNGDEVTGVTITPVTVKVTQTIVRRYDARDVGVRAITTGTVPDGYWLSSLTTTPSSVTLEGSPTALAGIEGFVDTLPVDVSSAISDLSVQTPLDLPEGVTAVDATGTPLFTVLVNAQIRERRGDVIITRALEITNPPAYPYTLEPGEIEVLLSGPLPTLQSIEADPDLVRVLLELPPLEPGESRELIPQIITPSGVSAQLITQQIIVSRTELPEGQ